MSALSRLALLALLLAPGLASAELIETEIENVTPEVAELRTSGGVTRLAIRYKNDGAKDANTDIYEISKIAMVDVRSKKKYAPIKDASGWYLGGPINDEIGGGRIYVKMLSQRQVAASSTLSDFGHYVIRGTANSRRKRS